MISAFGVDHGEISKGVPGFGARVVEHAPKKQAKAFLSEAMGGEKVKGAHLTATRRKGGTFLKEKVTMKGGGTVHGMPISHKSTLGGGLTTAGKYTVGGGAAAVTAGGAGAAAYGHKRQG